MSKYTTELRYICENLSGLNSSVGYTQVLDVVEKARVKIFDFLYPIFNEGYRQTIETKILLHFYTREIGMETYGLWKLRLMAKMNEIMPFYNKMYEMESCDFNPLNDVDYTSELTGSLNRSQDTTDTRVSKDVYERSLIQGGSQTTESEGDSNTVNKYSATPQGGLEGLMSDEYLTDATVNTGEANSRDILSKDLNDQENTSRDVNGTDTGHLSGVDNRNDITHVMGKSNSSKSYAEMFDEYRQKMVNVDMLVIGDLEELFMQLW